MYIHIKNTSSFIDVPLSVRVHPLLMAFLHGFIIETRITLTTISSLNVALILWTFKILVPMILWILEDQPNHLHAYLFYCYNSASTQPSIDIDVYSNTFFSSFFIP